MAYLRSFVEAGRDEVEVDQDEAAVGHVAAEVARGLEVDRDQEVEVVQLLLRAVEAVAEVDQDPHVVHDQAPGQGKHQ